MGGMLCLLASCQQAKPVTTATPAADATAANDSAATVTQEAARTAVARYVQGQPNASLYVVDSASVMEAGTQWQVLVPRTDWAGRMPNRAAFEVDKRTGAVSTLPVK